MGHVLDFLQDRRIHYWRGGICDGAPHSKDVVDRKGWVAKDDFVDVLGVAQTAPGPIAVNTSVYIGYMLRGFAGAAVSVAGCIIPPSIVIIMAIASVFDRISSLRVVQAAFAGIRPAVAVLIASAAVKLGKPVVRSGGELAIAAAALVMVSFFNISPALVIVIAAWQAL